MDSPRVPALHNAAPHHTVKCPSAVSALAVDTESARLFGGTQSGSIYVWNLASYELEAEFVGHVSSVLALHYVPGAHWLFSASCELCVDTD